jgi:ribonucleoside-diphosphate reductase alpha chain
MNITKRNGNSEELNFNKIVARIKKQCYSLDTNFVNVDKLAINVIQGLFDGATTRQIDELIAEQAASASTIHFDYSTLAARILVTSLHKDTSKSFSQTVEKLYSESLVSEIFYKNVQKNKKELDAIIVYDRDFNFDYFGYRTLEKSYLLKDRSGRIIERPQHLYMRVAVGIWGDNLEEILKSYEYMSQGYFTHATPTLFNAGTNLPQLSSCFLLKIDEDSLDEIYKILSDTAKISKLAGGIGISISKIRAKNSAIKGTNGKSDGIIPMLKVFNETARYVNQAGKRKGSFALYLEPWHDDVFDFIDLRKNSGAEELRARDLFLALWVNDLFMDAVNNDGDWWLMCPNESPNLHDVYGQEFNELYLKYVSEGNFRRKIKARDLWMKILENQIETGTPYIAYKDSINEKSNQKNIGVISSANLCNEVIQYTSKEESSVCNLASIGLPKFVENATFNFQKLYEVAYQAVRNLDTVIDVNHYPIQETSNSNFKHRPIGLGVQGLADVFAMFEVPFDSEFAKDLNKKIFETIHFASLTSSKDLAIEKGAYSTFEGSPISKGIFQFDMWEDRKVGTQNGKTDIIEKNPIKLSGMWDWETLRTEIKLRGIRNSLINCEMPTASTSQLLGNNECFEPFTSNIYKRNTLSGTFVVTNKFLIKDLIKLGVWDDNMKKRIMLADGSVQNIDEIPQRIKDIYKTVWELKMKDIIDMSADRSPFICQTQSLNLFFQNVNFAKLSSALMYGWKKGLKTGSYYIRTKSITEANKALGIDVSTINVPKIVVQEIVEEYSPEESVTCSLDNPDACMACSG